MIYLIGYRSLSDFYYVAWNYSTNYIQILRCGCYIICVNLINLNINEIKNLDDFSGIVPVFPLSSIVFFPNTLLPLHIFEQRYRLMLDDALNTEKIICMALLKPGWEKNYYKTPEIYTIAGMGRIVSTEKSEDGKSNIVLYGLKRVKIVEEINQTPYRLARIEILENSDSGSTEHYREKLAYLVTTWNDMIDRKNKEHLIKVNMKLPLENLTDVLSSVLMTNVLDKQKMLEETDVSKRAETLVDFIDTRLKAFSITSRFKSSIRSTRKLN